MTPKNLPCALALAFLNVAAAAPALATPSGPLPLIATMSNTVDNQLLIYSADGVLVKSMSTQGQGAVSGNSGGVAAVGNRIAVVNFASATVTVFVRGPGPSAYAVEELIATSGGPVSVAFGSGHLYILTTTQVESHALGRGGVDTHADGAANLLHADGSAAQVGVLEEQLIVTEKSNVIETFALSHSGAVAGAATLVADIPQNVNAPFGLVTRENQAYVTIAHADEISLVRRNAVITVTGSVSQHAPCWVALDGPYLYSTNSPSHSVSRYLVHGKAIVQEVAVAATFIGAPTDIAYGAGVLAVVDSAAGLSRVSTFNVDEDGNLTSRASVTLGGSGTNGVAVLPSGDLDR